jgi:hypothetical protein
MTRPRTIVGWIKRIAAMNFTRRPTRLWWMKRMDAVNFTVLGIIILVILLTTFR